MKVFVTGATGQLGYDCLRECLKRGYDVTGCGSRVVGKTVPVRISERNQTKPAMIPYVHIDISDSERVSSAVEKTKPDVIIHCAAWTDVDAAEKRENRERVFSINAEGTGNVAKAAGSVNAKMIYISTEYVFDGQGTVPWKTYDRTEPINLYGKSKLEGEKAAQTLLRKLFVVRTSWAFGINGNNYIEKMLSAGKNLDTVRVVDDQVGTPTYTPDLARLLLDMGETEEYGCYHATNEGGYISRYDFCREFYKQYGMSTRVVPVTTEEYSEPAARRPHNSRLDKSKLSERGFVPLPLWEDSIRRYLSERRMRSDMI